MSRRLHQGHTPFHGCYWCGRDMLIPQKRTLRAMQDGRLATRDHVVPLCSGGKRTVWACQACNALKGDMSPERWERFIKAFPRDFLMDLYRAKMPRGNSLYARAVMEGMKI